MVQCKNTRINAYINKKNGKNTVILSTEEYNNLRDFRMEIEKKSILVSNGYSVTKYTTILKDDLIDNITNYNKELTLENNRFKKDIFENKENSLEDKVKDISIWEFIKIKFKN